MTLVFALIDCNNFFVSCERLFRPDLEGKPVVVLSSNDGCAVSRSNEAKALGIPMGAPAFQYRELFRREGVVQFSANFELYGDISERITRLLTQVTPRTEVYSVDESFLDLSELNLNNYEKWGRDLRQRILQEVGIPVAIGIAPSKTLAKLAAERAKKDAINDNVLDLASLKPVERFPYLLNTPIKDIWGVGWRLTPKLRAEGLHTALDLAELRSGRAGQLMGVHGRQLVAELNGTCCHQLETFGKVRQSIMHGRMFGADTNQFTVIEAAIASLSARSAYRLRRDGLLARQGGLVLYTNKHKPGYLRQQCGLKFSTPTSDTGLLTAQFVNLASQLFKPSVFYHRANVMLYDLISEKALQTDLFNLTDLPGNASSQRRLAAVDGLNERYGKRTVHYAAEDLSQAWEPKRGHRSPRYTTSWEELPSIKV